MVTFISHSPSETEELGEGWGRECGRGWIIGLSGDLGTGKTQLVKGLARGLKAGGRVTSPSYALVHEYPGGGCRFFILTFIVWRRGNKSWPPGCGSICGGPTG